MGSLFGAYFPRYDAAFLNERVRLRRLRVQGWALSAKPLQAPCTALRDTLRQSCLKAITRPHCLMLMHLGSQSSRFAPTQFRYLSGCTCSPLARAVPCTIPMHAFGTSTPACGVPCQCHSPLCQCWVLDRWLRVCPLDLLLLLSQLLTGGCTSWPSFRRQSHQVCALGRRLL